MYCEALEALHEAEDDIQRDINIMREGCGRTCEYQWRKSLSRIAVFREARAAWWKMCCHT